MSKTIYQFKLKLLGVATLATALLIGLPVHAADKTRITASTNVQPIATLSAQESQALSLAAGRILLHTEKARLAIAEEDKVAALNEINQGLTLVKVVQNAMPKYKVTTKIKTGDVTYNANDEVGRRFVSIFDEQYIEDVIGPVVQSKKEDGKAVVSLGDFAAWQHSSMKLNIALASRALELAKMELNKDKSSNADSALAILQVEGVIFELDEVEMPLVEAADNLKLAELELSEGKSEMARTTLTVASDKLKKYELITGESRAKEVRKLHKKIDKLSESLKNGGSKNTLDKAKKEIASYWDRVRAWFK